jgi:superfamily II DNA or RNA helicase
MLIKKRSGLLISREHEYKEFYIKIKEFLERRSKAYNTSNYILNKFYVESEKFLLIPRNFPIQQYTFGLELEDYSHEGQEIDITHSIKPRSKSQERAMKHILTNNMATLQLAPGVGKTVISIFMIAERKRKSMVLVHRDDLAKQWFNRFKQFTNLKDDDISRLTSSTFNDDLDKPIIIATVQTFLSLLKRNRKDFLVKLNDANVGVFVADEVHTSIGAPTFSECSIHMPARYTYGLSATPYRYDGNGDIIEFHLGDIFSDDDIEGTMNARVTVLLLDYQIDIPARAKYIHWGGEFQRARYLNLIKKSKPFTEAIRGLLTKFKNRDLICISERIKLIEELHKWMPSKSKAMFCGTGGLETLNSKVTFATPGKCRDGIDAPWKDSIIMTSPISNIEQLTGRITRTSKGKQTPVIIDMLDYGCKDIAKTYYKREKFYDDKKWPVQYLFMTSSGKIRKIEREVAHQIIRGE